LHFAFSQNVLREAAFANLSQDRAWPDLSVYCPPSRTDACSQHASAAHNRSSPICQLLSKLSLSAALSIELSSTSNLQRSIALLKRNFHIHSTLLIISKVGFLLTKTFSIISSTQHSANHRSDLLNILLTLHIITKTSKKLTKSLKLPLFVSGSSICHLYVCQASTSPGCLIAIFCSKCF